MAEKKNRFAALVQLCVIHLAVRYTVFRQRFTGWFSLLRDQGVYYSMDLKPRSLEYGFSATLILQKCCSRSSLFPPAELLLLDNRWSGRRSINTADGRIEMISWHGFVTNNMDSSHFSSNNSGLLHNESVALMWALPYKETEANWINKLTLSIGCGVTTFINSRGCPMNSVSGSPSLHCFLWNLYFKISLRSSHLLARGCPTRHKHDGLYHINT